MPSKNPNERKTTRPKEIPNTITHHLINDAIDEYERHDNPIPDKESFLTRWGKTGRDRARNYRIMANKTPEGQLFEKLINDVLFSSEDLDSSAAKLRRRFTRRLCINFGANLKALEDKAQRELDQYNLIMATHDSFPCRDIHYYLDPAMKKIVETKTAYLREMKKENTTTNYLGNKNL